MLKRTAAPSYTEKMSRSDAQAARMSGVVDGQQDFMSRLIARDARDTAYEKKRLANAKRSGKGPRECLRRIARTPLYTYGITFGQV